ncbi:MAG: formylglycine-generating enzyme family protein [Bradymonadia bacterium]
MNETLKGQVAGATDNRPALVRIPAGPFVMGSPAGEEGRYERESQIQVEITADFLMAQTPITQSQYAAVVGTNPSFHSEGPEAAQCPVETVNWFGALHYCNALSELEGLTPYYEIDTRRLAYVEGADGYRLPTEAQWEYAARAGTTTRFHQGDTVLDLATEGWFQVNAGDRPRKVAQLKANAYGLYDMLGNVYEWVGDRFYGDYNTSEPTIVRKDPTGAEWGKARVIRGGSYLNGALTLRCAHRSGRDPGEKDSTMGFRVVRPA